MTMQDLDPVWLLAQLKPNCGRIALRNLHRQGFRSYLPLIEETMRAGRSFVTRKVPLFPGYVFVADQAENAHRWRAINATTGIARLVSFGARPARVPGAFIAGLMQHSADGETLLPVAVAPGDTVRLATGPFADFVATVERIAPDRRVMVLIELLGRPTRLTVPAERIARQSCGLPLPPC